MICDCIECRIRRALPEESGYTNTADALHAIGNVTSELLTHRTAGEAKRFVAELLKARKRWMKSPRVAVQHPEGSA